MKTLGIIGGMSWESTALYYRMINDLIRERLGGQHSASLILHSLDFAEIEQLQSRGDWEGSAQILCTAAKGLEVAGAELLLIATNTMHLVAPQVAAAVDIPLLHIAAATGRHINSLGIERVGLLGTSFTMEQGFYKNYLRDNFGLDVLVPDDDARVEIHRVIYDELCLGRVDDSSRQMFCQQIETLQQAGAEAVILGCTEIGLLITEADVVVPLLDTTRIHTQAAVEQMLSSH